MNCYDCHQNGTAAPAIGICEECGAGVCPQHAVQASQNRQVTLPMGQIVRQQIRELLCTTCQHALSQPLEATRRAS